MPLMADKGRIPTHCGGKDGCLLAEPVEISELPSGSIRVALINNMPDSALEDTERQFFGLLGDAAGELPVHLRLYSLPNVPRGERGKQHLRNLYCSTDELWEDRADALIITGTEPQQVDLRDEPYWGALAELLDWAETNTQSAILSCLAAHASVLHSDGIVRHRLKDKQFGVFDQKIVGDHALTSGVSEPLRFPHSRWNELPEQQLASSGYLVLTRSPEAGVDSFLKKKRHSLFVHFQGHPEYGAQTLLREYRRDIGRFLRKERETYPAMPRGYFDSASLRMLAEFQANAVLHRHEELLAAFPQGCLASALQHSWRHAAVRMYRNWLQYIASRKIDAGKVAVAVKTAVAAQTYVNTTMRDSVPAHPYAVRHSPPQAPLTMSASLESRRTK